MSIRAIDKVIHGADACGSDLLLLIMLADWANDAGEGFYYVGPLAEKLRLSERRTQRLLKKAELNGFTTIERAKKRGERNLFKLHPLLISKGDADVTHKDFKGDADVAVGVTPASPNTVKRSRNSTTCVGTIPDTLDSMEFHEAWAEWCDYRKSAKKALTQATAKRQLAKLAEMGELEAIQSIFASIEHGWTGLFRPKVNGKPRGNVKSFSEKEATTL